jgi:hypothetical protein
LFRFRKIALLFATLAVAGFFTASAASAAVTHTHTQWPGGNNGHINPGGPNRGFPHLPQPVHYLPPPVAYYPITTVGDCGCGDTYVPPPVVYTAPTTPSCGCTATAPVTTAITVTTNCTCSDTLALNGDSSGGLYFLEESGPKLAVGDWFTYDGSTYYVTYVDGNCFSAENASDVYPTESYGSGIVYEFGYDQGLSFLNYKCLSTGDLGGIRYGGYFPRGFFSYSGQDHFHLHLH